MKTVRFRKKTIAIGVIGFLVVIVGLAAAIGATRSLRSAGEGGGDVAVSAPAMGDPAAAERTPEEAEKAADAATTAQAGGAGGDLAGALPPLPAGTQYLVRSGRLTIVVEKGGVPEAVTQITTVTRAFDGYILSSVVGSWPRNGTEPAPPATTDAPPDAGLESVSSDAGVPYAYVTVRIPAERFDDALERLQKLGNVHELSTSTDDVTAQIVDLRARLRHYRAVEERLLSFLDKAKTVSAALAVQDRIDQTQLLVEEIEAQIKQLDETVTYSTLSISLSEKGSPLTADGDDDSFWGAITHSLRLVGDGFRWIIVAAGAALPFLVVLAALGAVILAVRRFVSRRRRAGQTGRPAPPSAGSTATSGAGST